jgi:hypothetical protein
MTDPFAKPLPPSLQPTRDSTLRRIAVILNDMQWYSETREEVAAVMRKAGFEIEEPT